MYERRAIEQGRQYRPRRPLPILDRLPKKSPIYERLSDQIASLARDRAEDVNISP